MVRTQPANLRLYYIQRPPPSLEGLSGLQSYFPSLETLFPSIADHTTGSPTLASMELLVRKEGEMGVVENIVSKKQRSTPIWIRKVHLVDPIDVMSGEIVLPNDGVLPTFRNAWQRTLRKINDPMNEAYTDAVFACMASRLRETGKSPHWCCFFGTFTCRVPEFRYNITENMPDIETEHWFHDGLKNGSFKIYASDPMYPANQALLERPWQNVRPTLIAAEGSSHDSESICRSVFEVDVEHQNEESFVCNYGGVEEDDQEIEEVFDTDVQVEVKANGIKEEAQKEEVEKEEAGKEEAGKEEAGKEEAGKEEAEKEKKEEREENDIQKHQPAAKSGPTKRIVVKQKLASPAPSFSSLSEAELSTEGEETIQRPRLQLSRISSTSSKNNDSLESSYDDDDLKYMVALTNFPVQITILEQCDGTMDDLMEQEITSPSPDMRETKEERWTAWIFQVIAALTVAQQTYDFIHNDLHTNNVMWCGTGETHLYYHIKGAIGGDRVYKVPTYGRIFKIIDFGRATFRPPVFLSSDEDGLTHKKHAKNTIWFPDSFAPGADAGGQYNCGPYFEQGKPKVLPNKSFDLCRLSVAILDTLWPDPEGLPATKQPQKILTKETGRVQYETESPLWNLLWLWLTDKEGKNILRTPDGNERYPEFDLYCAIARNAQNAIPAQQLTLPLFDSVFRCRYKEISHDVPIWNLQAQHA